MFHLVCFGCLCPFCAFDCVRFRVIFASYFVSHRFRFVVISSTVRQQSHEHRSKHPLCFVCSICAAHCPDPNISLLSCYSPNANVYPFLLTCMCISTAARRPIARIGVRPLSRRRRRPVVVGHIEQCHGQIGGLDRIGAGAVQSGGGQPTAVARQRHASRSELQQQLCECAYLTAMDMNN